MLGDPEARRIPEKLVVLLRFQGGELDELIGVVHVQAFGVARPPGRLGVQGFQHFGRLGKTADAAGIGVTVLFIKTQHGLAGSLVVYHALSHGDPGFVQGICAYVYHIGNPVGLFVFHRGFNPQLTLRVPFLIVDHFEYLLLSQIIPV